MKLCSVDPGFSGGVAVWNEDGTLIECIPMPIKEVKVSKKTRRKIDGVLLSRFLKKHNITNAIIEQVHSQPLQGGVGNFSFGENFGNVKGIFECMELEYNEVSPMRWKKRLFGERDKTIAEEDRKKHNKEIAIQFVLDKFPNVELKRTARSKNYHDGMADAICIGYYYFIKDIL